MQQERFKFFKSQDLEIGNFDVTFEIEGKKLFAHRFILIPVSEYMNAMLSDRWSNKDEIIKIESYSYDNFYQFLCFLYSGRCYITNENVFQLIDMSEFYGVSFFKDSCDKYFRSNKGILTFENCEEMFDISQKYSLRKMEIALEVFICSNFDEITKAEKLFSYEKPFMDFLSSINYSNEKVFEVVYKWTEHQIMKRKKDASENKNFDLLKVVKDELLLKFPKIYSLDKTKMEFGFLMNFILEKGFLISPFEFKTLFTKPSHLTEDDRFNFVYELAEKQALQKQKMSSDSENFNIVDSIKADLSEVFKIVKFIRMNVTFLMDFVVEKGIFLSANEIKAIYSADEIYIMNFNQNQEYSFKLVYHLAEKQSKKKQELSPDANFNLIPHFMFFHQLFLGI
uniref:BTB domain-containing protein n=1 Tax=Panagrolaimus davidi TaxID=227884 RepID=A0A914QC93_9BILA